MPTMTPYIEIALTAHAIQIESRNILEAIATPVYNADFSVQYCVTPQMLAGVTLPFGGTDLSRCALRGLQDDAQGHEHVVFLFSAVADAYWEECLAHARLVYHDRNRRFV